MSKLIVAKFGGTSVADFDAMSRCADIILSDAAIRLVVVSASSGVTNLLVDITKHTDVTERYACYQGIERITLAVLNRLQQPDSVAADIDQLLSALKELIEQSGAVYSAAHKDEIQSFGERLSSVLFAQVLRAALEGQTGLAGLVLLQCLLAEIGEELDMHLGQHMARFLEPVLGLIGLQQAFLGGTADLAVQVLQGEAYFLGLGLGASEMEIKVRYRQLARKYHPDKNDPAITGLATAEASDFFKLLNNANEYLKERQ